MIVYPRGHRKHCCSSLGRNSRRLISYPRSKCAVRVSIPVINRIRMDWVSYSSALFKIII